MNAILLLELCYVFVSVFHICEICEAIIEEINTGKAGFTWKNLVKRFNSQPM